MPKLYPASIFFVFSLPSKNAWKQAVLWGDEEPQYSIPFTINDLWHNTH